MNTWNNSNIEQTVHSVILHQNTGLDSACREFATERTDISELSVDQQFAKEVQLIYFSKTALNDSTEVI
jgi:hypothetical protein